MSSVPEELLDSLLKQDGALEQLQAVQRKRRLGPNGEEHPLYAWRPGCPPYQGDNWVREGKLYYQRDLLTCEARTMGVICANGVGKSETGARLTAARLRLHDPLTLRSWDHPQEIWVATEAQNVDSIYQRILKFLPRDEIARKTEQKQNQELWMKNGSHLKMKSHSLTREGFQGENLDFIWIDEEGRPHHWTEITARSRKPGFQRLLTFTPMLGTVFMHEQLRLKEVDKDTGKSIYEGKMFGPLAIFSEIGMEDSPFLPDDYIEEMKEECSRDEDEYAIRILGKYRLMAGRHFFDERKLAASFEAHANPIAYWKFPQRGEPEDVGRDYECWAVFREPIPGHSYAMAADLSEGGEGGDYTAIHIIDATTGEQAARWHGRVDPGDAALECYFAAAYYNTALINWEMNSHGAAFLKVLRDMHYPRLALRESMSGRVKTELQTYGFRTDRHTKHAVTQGLRNAFHDGQIVIHDELTLKEMSNFGYLKKDISVAGKHGLGALSGHDDLVMALAIAWWTAGRAGNPRGPLSDTRTIGEKMEDWAKQRAEKSSRRGRILLPGIFSAT